MAVKYTSFAGWEKNLKLFNDSVEVIITLEVGPRIISYRPLEGRSVFKLVDQEAGKSNEEGWRIRGGHRLWIAPEDFGKKDGLTYARDNSQVEHAIDDEFTVRVSQLIENPAKIHREMVITLERTGPKVTVEHRITNKTGAALELAPWAVSVMAPAGYAVIPQPPSGTHPQRITFLTESSSPGRLRTLPTNGCASDGGSCGSAKLIGRRSSLGCAIPKGGRLTSWATICSSKAFHLSKGKPTLTSGRTLRLLRIQNFSNSRPSVH
jgi:hypothetical protein